MTTLPLSARLATGFATGLGSLIRVVERRRAYAQLSRLDDHLLRDIGLSRADVEDMRRFW